MQRQRSEPTRPSSSRVTGGLSRNSSFNSGSHQSVLSLLAASSDNGAVVSEERRAAIAKELDDIMYCVFDQYSRSILFLLSP